LICRRANSQLGYQNYPRDRFVEKINLTTQLALVTINLLYRGKSGGRLKANPAGELYHRHVCLRDHVEEKKLFEVNNVIECLLDLIGRCRDHTYAEQTDCYSEDIDRLIRLKRTIFAEELVLD
jgi:hypothetical protein